MADNAPGPDNTKVELRKFGLIMGTGILLIFGLFFPWMLERPWPVWPFATAAVLILLGLVFPLSLRPLNIVWMKFGHIAGWINTRIILGVVFFCVFLPVGMVMRLFGKDPMKRKLDGGSSSYRIPSHSSPRDQMERPF